MAVLSGRQRCHLQLRTDLPDDTLRSTTAHELFHCFQEYVEADVVVEYAPWLWESTAVWSEEFVYPDINREHDYDGLFFSSLNSLLFDTTGTKEYAAYLYWFFLYQREGKTGDVVRDMYHQIHQEGTLPTIAGRDGFYGEYKEYALWNLNTRPHQYYEDFHDLPDLSPSDSSILHSMIYSGYRDAQMVYLAEGGMHYYCYNFEEMVDKVTFDLREVRKRDGNQNGVQIVYRIDGAWRHEDVSLRDEFSFCRSRDAENVDAIILIISNGNLDFDAPNPVIDGYFYIDTTEWCAQEWHGLVECAWNHRGEGDGRGRSVGEYQSSGTRRIEETLLYDAANDRYFTVDYTISQNSDYRWDYEPPRSDDADFLGYTEWERRVEDIAVGKTVYLEIPEGCPSDCSGLVRRILPAAEEFSGVYQLNDTLFSNIGEYESVYSAYYVPGTLGEMQGHVPEERGSTNRHNLTVSIPAQAMELILSDDGLSMTGDYAEGNMTCHAEYTFD
jgi:hypothetical protein